MKMYMPLPDLQQSAMVLDNNLLQITTTEVEQALYVLCGIKTATGWRSKPAIDMWRTYEVALYLYFNHLVTEAATRGLRPPLYPLPVLMNQNIKMPHWFGLPSFHEAQQSELIRIEARANRLGNTSILIRRQGAQAPDRYARMFVGVPDNLKFVWPKPVQGTDANYVCKNKKLVAVMTELSKTMPTG